MNIKRCRHKVKIIKISIINGGVGMITVTQQRPCTILQSMEESFKQIGEHKKGKRKFKTLKESQSLWDKWSKEVEKND